MSSHSGLGPQEEQKLYLLLQKSAFLLLSLLCSQPCSFGSSNLWVRRFTSSHCDLGSRPNAAALQSQQRHYAAIFLNFFGYENRCHCCQTLKAIQRPQGTSEKMKTHSSDAKMVVLAILSPVSALNIAEFSDSASIAQPFACLLIATTPRSSLCSARTTTSSGGRNPWFPLGWEYHDLCSSGSTDELEKKARCLTHCPQATLDCRLLNK